MKRLLLCTALLMASCSTSQVPDAASTPAETKPAAASPSKLGRSIAKAYSIGGWDDIQELNFTFNVQRPGQDKPASRKWTWYPRENTVTLHREGQPPLMYPREIFEHGEPVQATIDADKQFINDSYWFLFPFQLAWSNPTVTDHGPQPLPIGEGTARKVTAQWPAEGGYTPGDAYDIYLDRDRRIVQWTFRKGGGPDDEGRPMTWEGNVKLGPIIAATEHWSPDRKVRLWFSDISAKVGKGDDLKLVTPMPLEEDR